MLPKCCAGQLPHPFVRVLAVLLLLACTTESVRPYVVIDSGVSAGKRFASPYFDVITQAEQFTRLFRELHAHQLPPPTPPAVNFAASLVLIAARGEKPTTGYGIDVERLARRGDVLQVHLRLRDPLPTASQATMLTQPFVMVQVQKEPGVKQVEFLDQDAVLLASLPIPGLAQQ